VLHHGRVAGEPHWPAAFAAAGAPSAIARSPALMARRLISLLRRGEPTARAGAQSCFLTTIFMFMPLCTVQTICHVPVRLNVCP
jgi:hypothetical protein